MKFELTDVLTNKDFLNKELYVCAYQPGNFGKAARSITSTFVTVVSQDDYKSMAISKKKVPLSDNIFIKTAIKSKKLNYEKPIAPYDQNASEYKKSGGLFVFDNIAECNECYIRLLNS